MAVDNISSGGRFANFTKLINSSGGGESGDPWDDSPLLARRAGDHVCRPVIIDSDGRATPVTDFTVLDVLPPPHRQHRETFPVNAGSRAQSQLYGRRDAYEEGRRGFNWAGGRAEEPAAAVGRGGWDRPGWALEGSEMGTSATNSFQAVAEFLWGKARPSAGSRPSPYAPQQGEESSAVPVIDSSDAAEKYGGRFVW